ncbi:hypothetical protein B296_00044512 [Ensete ventricosum]|uniref:Retrotransposon gag domain-containing protein n=1 Tax=Ensete ventricosum TaxID=4639 RepID=A0A426X0L9_ENSVE|nr:hypothetical protein B296_00044512 [Ensete ventricosum]
MAQGSDEPLSQFVGRFTSQVQGIPDLHPSLAIQAFLTGLRPSRFFWSLIERPPTTLPEMLQWVHQYMTAETLIASKRDEMKRSPGGTVSWASGNTSEEEGRQGLLKAPSPMKSHPERRDKRRYCRFHREYGHDTEECCDLQYQIEDLIRHGHLRRYGHEQPSLPDGRPSRDLSPRPHGPVEKQIDVIFGGPTSGGNSSSARKAYAWVHWGFRLSLGNNHDPCHVRGGTKVKDSASVIYGGQAPIRVQRHHRASDPQSAQGGRVNIPSDPGVPNPSWGRQGQK